MEPKAASKIKIIPAPDFNLNGQPLSQKPTLTDYDHYRITDETDIQPPNPVVRIAGQIICTPEAITVISGLPKSGKSAFCSILIAGAIAPFNVDGLNEVEVTPNGDRKAVIHFDTEQAPWKQQANQRTILTRAELEHCPENYLSYNIRQMEVENMQKAVSEICEIANNSFGGIHSIFVDGVADFIKDPNDPTASFDIVKYFEGIAQDYFCPVIVVVHTNPGSDKERGHAGSQLQRKAESILSIKKEGEVSYIDPKLLRHAGDNIPKIQFMYDVIKGYHSQCSVKAPQDKKALEKLVKLQGITDKVFTGDKALKYNDCIDRIMRETGRSFQTAKNMFSEMKGHNLINRNSVGLWGVFDEFT